MHEAVRGAIRSGNIRSAHDLAEGGLLVALAECAIGGAHQLGAKVDLGSNPERLDALLFGETQSRALLTVPANKLVEVVTLLHQHSIEATQIGTVGGDTLSVKTSTSPELRWDVATLYEAWDRALDSYLA